MVEPFVVPSSLISGIRVATLRLLHNTSGYAVTTQENYVLLLYAALMKMVFTVGGGSLDAALGPKGKYHKGFDQKEKEATHNVAKP
ncbi:hypothetical protein NC653_031967 [Populus alba x Populus x berolinensis]|uniref:Uncharacterized protein n=1 Tax=Populus alba x Populus x berolinensis TaxID=444605 RepID=A0AAD6Q2A2_9ROSI|nr:hypothetical protein NC653_031967 [Populus alba x Populus x berolinensis]